MISNRFEITLWTWNIFSVLHLASSRTYHYPTSLSLVSLYGDFVDPFEWLQKVFQDVFEPISMHLVYFCVCNIIAISGTSFSQSARFRATCKNLVIFTAG